MAYSKKFNYIKKIIFYIYDFECQLCGVFTFELELHHLDNNHLNDKLKNLKPLCKKCHKLAHKNISLQLLYFKLSILEKLRKFQIKLQSFK